MDMQIINDKLYLVNDLEKKRDLIFHIRDIGNGAEKNRLECFKNNRLIWSFNSVGPDLYVKGESIFVLKSKNKLWYNCLLELDIETGEVVARHYEEEDKEFNLYLVKTEHTFFIIRDNYDYQNCMIYLNGRLKLIGNSRSELFYPIGIYKNRVCYFEYLNKKWNPVGFEFPYQIHGTIEYISLKEKIVIQKYFGRKTVYSFKKGLKYLFSYFGSIILNPFIYDSLFKNFYLDTPDRGLVQISYEKNQLKIQDSIENYGILQYQFHKSYDFTNVPSITVYPNCKATGLMIVGYGAYGMETTTSMWRWKPYLNDGWIISFILVRGSGDHTREWAEQGKTVNKIKSVEDFESSIRFLQKKYKISPKYTCIYGRSAGGYLIGSVVSRNSSGKLFSMVYTEVPYVDILRTTTNPNLPLTPLEYKEFGNPTRSIYEFQELLKLSPIDSLEYNKPPEVFVLTRTSENDSQVYTYEALKWIKALRGKNSSDTSKLIYISENEGHFIKEDSLYTNLAEDFFLLKRIR
jgi:protease II